jgi:rhodanese-related sulfurtransferase
MDMNLKFCKLVFWMLSISLLAWFPPAAHAQFGEFFGGGADVEVVDTATLSKMLQARAKAQSELDSQKKDANSTRFVLVDVRSDAEVNVSVIPGAITKAEYEKNEGQYVGQLVIPYCTVGGRSNAYAKQLVKKGVTVKNYKGSILEWVAAELPLVTLEGKPTNRVHTSSSRYRVPDKYEQVTN